MTHSSYESTSGIGSILELDRETEHISAHR